MLKVNPSSSFLPIFVTPKIKYLPTRLSIVLVVNILMSFYDPRIIIIGVRLIL